MRSYNRVYSFLSHLSGAIVILFLLAGCDILDDLSDSGDSGDSTSFSAPSSLLGYKLVQTVENAEVVYGDASRYDFLVPGQTLTYQFIDSNTILGEGLNTIPTNSWTYSRSSGNQGNISLYYTGGESHDVLTFNTSTAGGFVSEQSLYSGAKVIYTGSFRISTIDNGTNGGSDTVPACEKNKTGTLTFWSSYSENTNIGSITLTVNGLGTRTTRSWFNSAPSCGSTQTGVITFSDIPAGSYSYSAKDEVGGTWGPSSTTVTTCGCVRVELK